jgi:peptide chain release factor 1
VIETRPKRSFGMSLDSSMDKVLERRREVEDRLSDSANMSNSDLAQFSRELSDLRPVCEQIELVRRIEAELADALVMVDEAGDDLDMLEMAQAEVDLLKEQLPLPKPPCSFCCCQKTRMIRETLFLRCAPEQGGDEAALFASNLFSMYQRFAAKHGWKFEVMEVSETGIGGYKEATATISGRMFLRG